LSEAVNRPVITPADRLGLTVCLAIICHAILVLGVTFSPEDMRSSRYNTMDIVLVQQRSRTDEEAKLLAQADLEGGGDTEEPISPSTPLPPPFPDNQPEAASPPPEPAPQAPAAETAARPESETAVRETEVPLAVEADAASKSNIRAEAPAEPENPEPREPEKAAARTSSGKPRPSATTLLANSLKIAALSARVNRNLVAKAERPRRKFISASTREYRYAAYMEAWRSKVERVGNLNYPEEARKRGLSGSLVLDVALNPDGSINMITVRRPSGRRLGQPSTSRGGVRRGGAGHG